MSHTQDRHQPPANRAGAVIGSSNPMSGEKRRATLNKRATRNAIVGHGPSPFASRQEMSDNSSTSQKATILVCRISGNCCFLRKISATSQELTDSYFSCRFDKVK
jgi:hypothetical protein